MDGVATEIAEEVGVLFQHRDFNACTSEQEAKHDARRTTADDAACGVEDSRVSHRVPRSKKEKANGPKHHSLGCRPGIRPPHGPRAEGPAHACVLIIG